MKRFAIIAAGISALGVGCESSDRLPAISAADSCATAGGCLPRVAGGCECLGQVPRPTPSSCAWALSNDVVALVRVVQSELSTAPTAMPVSPGAGEYELIESCQKSGRPALKMHVEIEEKLSGDSPDTLTVHVGADQLRLWRGAPPAAGQLIGVGLRHVAEPDVWSLMGEPIFNFTSHSGAPRVSFQLIDGACCREPAPAELVGLDLTDLRSTLGRCKDPRGGAKKRREMMTQRWGRTPQSFMSAWYCFDDVRVDLPSGSCVTDTECGAGTVCRQSTCISP